MPKPGANIRLYTVALSLADSGEKRKMGSWSTLAAGGKHGELIAAGQAIGEDVEVNVAV